MVNLELYKIFKVVADYGNISKASKYLFISQPAITKQIKNLESSLNIILFKRTQKGMILTDEGRNLYFKIKEALDIISSAESDTLGDKSLERGIIRIGIGSTLSKTFLLEHIIKFRNAYPNVVVELNTNPSFKTINYLKNGKLDFVIAKKPLIEDNELIYTFIKKLDNIFIAGDSFLELRNKNLNASDICDYPFLLQTKTSNNGSLIRDYCTKNNVKFNTKMYIDSSNLITEFVSSGFGISIVTKLFVQKELDCNKIFELNVSPKIDSGTLCLITLNNNKLGNAASQFVNDLFAKE